MKTSILGLKELRENMNKYINKTKKGRSFIVVRRSKPVFKISAVDMFGDEGHWESIGDFTKIKKDGIPAEDFLKALRSLDAKKEIE